MRRALAAAFLSGAAACAAPVVETPEPGVLQPAAPPATADALPAGSDLLVRLSSDLSAADVTRGQTFTATVTEPLVALNRDTVVAAGAEITGMVTGIDRSSGAGDQAAIRINFLRIDISGTTHPFTVDILAADLPSSAGTAAPQSGAPARGTVIEGELRDALIEAGLDVGAGTIISLGTGEAEEVLPAGTVLTVRTRDTINLRRG